MSTFCTPSEIPKWSMLGTLRFSNRTFRIFWPETLILLTAGILRLWDLDLKPPHFDEGINGWFADRMLPQGCYQYDPENYHGPLHFYAIFFFETLFGHTITVLRLPTVLISFLSVILALCFQQHLGRLASLVAATALAVSPGAVFYGRYSIHESWLAFFLMLTAWGILGLWQKGTRLFLFATISGLTGMILTKETYIIHAASFVLALPCLWVWERLVASRPAYPLVRQEWTWRELMLGVGLSIFTIILFYSGTFLHWPGILGLYKTYALWFHTGMQTGGHEKEAYQYSILNIYWFMLMIRYEWPAVLGLLACFRFLAPSSALIRYLAIYAGGVLVAYSIIRYKTPWCIICILWPFYFVLGTLVQEFRRHFLTWILVGLACFASFIITLHLNFWRFTDPKEPYVYVQTYPEITKLTAPLLILAEQNPTAYHLKGGFFLDSYYPLPWMLRDFTHISYYGKDKPLPETLDYDFLATENSKADALASHLKEPYYRVPFRLRSAQEDCVAFFRTRVFAPVFEQRVNLE